MSTSENVQRLRGELAAFVVAKDDEGVRRAYQELLCVGRSRQEVMDEIIRLSRSTDEVEEAIPDGANLTPSDTPEPEIIPTDMFYSTEAGMLLAGLGADTEMAGETGPNMAGERVACRAVRSDRSSSESRRKTIKLLLPMAALAVVASITGLVFLYGNEPKAPIATDAIDPRISEQALDHGSFGPGWQLLEHTVGLAISKGTPDALFINATPASTKLLDGEDFSAPQSGTALIVSPREGDVAMGPEPLSGSATLAGIPSGVKAAGGGPNSTSGQLRRTVQHSSATRRSNEESSSKAARAAGRSNDSATRAAGIRTIGEARGEASDIVGRSPAAGTCPNGYVLYISACYPAR